MQKRQLFKHSQIRQKTRIRDRAFELGAQFREDFGGVYDVEGADGEGPGCGFETGGHDEEGFVVEAL